MSNHPPSESQHAKRYMPFIVNRIPLSNEFCCITKLSCFYKNIRLVHVKLSNNEMPNALGVGFAIAIVYKIGKPNTEAFDFHFQQNVKEREKDMKKKLLAIFVAACAACMALALVGCGSNSSSNDSKSAKNCAS